AMLTSCPAFEASLLPPSTRQNPRFSLAPCPKLAFPLLPYLLMPRRIRRRPLRYVYIRIGRLRLFIARMAFLMLARAHALHRAWLRNTNPDAAVIAVEHAVYQPAAANAEDAMAVTMLLMLNLPAWYVALANAMRVSLASRRTRSSPRYTPPSLCGSSRTKRIAR